MGYAPLTHLLLLVYILQYRVAAGSLSPDDAAERVAKVSAYVDIDGFAKIDHQRGARTGLPEVVFGQGKATHHIVQIMQVLMCAGWVMSPKAQLLARVKHAKDKRVPMVLRG